MRPVDVGTGPASVGAVRRGYVDQAVVGYLVYSVGAVTAFLAVGLALTDAEAGLHSTALATGMVVAGLTSHRLDARLTMRRVHFLGLGAIALAMVFIWWAPAFLATLAGAAGVGFGAGLLLGHINQVMTAGGGALARVRLARSTLVAMMMSVTVPLFIGVGEAAGIGWQLALVPAAALVGVASVATRGFEERPTDVVAGQARLRKAFWVAWALLILVIAIEFMTVFWSGAMVERRTGVPLAEATLAISAFIGGVIAGRLALSTQAVSARDPVWLMRGGIVVAMVGLLLPWASTSYEISLVGTFVAGIGLGPLYPLGATITLATAPDHARLASSRLVLASGAAILVAPLILGVAADIWGSRQCVAAGPGVLHRVVAADSAGRAGLGDQS